MASAIGRGPLMGMVSPFKVSSRRRRSPFVTSWAFRSGGMPDSSSTTGIISRGTSAPATFCMSLLAFSDSSRTRRASSFSSSRAGFRSMTAL